MIELRETIRFDSRKLVKALAATAAALVVVHLTFVGVRALTGHDYVYGLMPLFDLNGEDNLPSFFTGSLFLVNAVLVLFVAGSATGSRSRSVWLLLSGLFVFLSFDDFCSVHERLTEPVRNALHTSGLLYHAWVIVYVPAVALVAAIFLPVWSRLVEPARRRLAVAAGIYLLGAVGVEMASGAYRGHNPGWTAGYSLLVALEESLEMAGLILTARALLGLLDRRAGGPSIVFEGGD